MGCSLEEVQKKLDQAYKQYKVCRTNNKVLRCNFLESLAVAKAEAGNWKAAQVIKDMQQQEMMRNNYKRIRYTTRSRQSATTKIHIKDKGRTREVTKKREMEKYIIKENEQKFHQTEGRCPLLHGQLYRDLGQMGEGPRVADVLDGTYVPPPGTSQITQDWLQRMKIDNATVLEQTKTSLEEYQRGWKIVNECTASGELHMGHFKAGALHHGLSWIHFEMSLLPMMTGYSPTRWRRGIDVMLLKDPDVYLLHKLRTIVLYEADFNHENKRLGRDAMNMALDQRKIADKQFSRPGRSAQDNALSKQLVFDYFCTIKQPFAMCTCDLKLCYDRVVHTAASLALQRVGVPLAQIQ